MTPAFYQDCWSIFGKDVVTIVQHFVVSSTFEEECSDAHMIFILGKNKPKFMIDLWTITLCNIIYKNITKVITNKE